MTNLSSLVVLNSYGDLITTTNAGQGLNGTLLPIQDGLGHQSPLQLATNAFNISRANGNTFQLDGISLVAQAIYINEVCQPDPIIPGMGGMVVPSGTTLERNDRNGTIRYNTSTGAIEFYANDAWVTGSGTGDVTGPAGSVARNIPIFADTTGKLLEDSGVNIGALPPVPRSPKTTTTDIFLIGVDGIDFNSTGQSLVNGNPVFVLYENTPGLCPVSMVVSDLGLTPTTDSSLLELKSTTGAFVLSRMTNTEMDALDPTSGMVLYNTTEELVYAYQNGSWTPIGEGGSVTSIAAVSDSSGLVITGSPITSTGTFTFTLGAQLEGLSLLASDGLVTRTAYGTYTSSNITGTSNQIIVTNGDGVAGNPTISLASTLSDITSATIGDLNFTTNVISSVNSDENIVLTPNGTGIVTTPILQAGDILFETNVIRSAYSNENIVLTPNGTGIVILPTTQVGHLYISGSAIISINVDEHIFITPNGSGIVVVPILQAADFNFSDNTITTINTNENIIFSPNGTGVVQVASEFDLLNDSQLRFYDTPNSYYVGFQPPSLTGSSVYTLPTTYPSISGQVLSSDNSGNLSWTSNTSGVTIINGTADQINVTSVDTVYTISLSDNAIFPGVEGVTVPSGGSSDRPFPHAGIIRHNSDYDNLETFNLTNLSWNALLTIDNLVGTTGQIDISTTLFGDVEIGIDSAYLSLITTAASEASTAAAEATGAAAAAAASALGAAGAAVTAAEAATAAAVSAASANEAAEELTFAVDAKFILQEVNTSLPYAQSLGVLTTGLLKNNVTSAVGVLTTAVPGVDYYAPGYPTYIYDTGSGGNFFIGTNDGNAIVLGIGNTSAGWGCLTLLVTGSENTSFGYNSLASVVTNNYNSSFGCNSLAVNIADGNSSFGFNALTLNTIGIGCSAFGTYALATNVSGTATSAFGYQALQYSTGGGNNAFGYQSLNLCSTGLHNNAFGTSSLTACTTGGDNSAFGHNSLHGLTTGGLNCSFGENSGFSITIGSSNCSFGNLALASVVTNSLNCAFGYQSLEAFTGANTCAFGAFSLATNISGVSCSAFGHHSLLASTGNNNSAFGSSSLVGNGSGSQNSAFGASSLATVNTGNDNSSFGYNALFGYTGSYSCAFGSGALAASSSGTGLCAFGYQSLTLNTGSQNSGFGYQSLASVIIGANNSAFGFEALKAVLATNNSAFGCQSSLALTTGIYNNSFGYQSLQSCITGNDNCAFGSFSLSGNTGNYNSAFGHQALAHASAVSGSCAFGFQALYFNDGGQNSAFGYQSLLSNSVGINNCSFGYASMYANSSGSNNNSFGVDGLATNSTGGDNNSFGYQALNAITGSYNCAFGHQAISNSGSVNGLSAFGNQALYSNTTGTGLCAFGFQASYSNNDGSQNSSFGYNALASCGSGSNNTSVGYESGYFQGTYNNCTFLGAGADAAYTNLTNATAIGYNALVYTSNSLVLGSGANVGIGTSSPESPLHIVGTFQQKGITSGWTGTDLLKGQAETTTSGTVPSQLLTIPVPTSIDTAIFVKVDIACMRTSGASAAYGQSFQGAFYNGTTTATIGTAATITLTNSGTFGVSAVWAISGANLLLTVTGVSGANINWVVNYEYFAVTTSTS